MENRRQDALMILKNGIPLVQSGVIQFPLVKPNWETYRPSGDRWWRWNYEHNPSQWIENRSLVPARTIKCNRCDRIANN